MKKILFFKTLLITALLGAGANGAWGQASYNHSYTVSDGVTIEAAAGQGYGYFLYNVGAGKFFTGGRGWGAFATADHAGKIVEFIALSTNYKIHNKHVSANSVSFFEGYLPESLWADNNNETEANQTWTFAKVGDENKYTIYSTAQNKYLCYGTNTELALGETANSDNYYWIIVPKTVRDAAGDYTYYIQNQGFNRPWEKPVWNGIADDSNSANHDPAFSYFAMNWDATNPCAEKYHAVFNLYQQISETVPNGKYKVYAQAFYRQDDNGTGPAPTLYANSDNQTLAVLNANSEGTTQTMDGASTAFTAGQYVNQVTTVVTNGSLKVGIDITQADQWVIWDNFVIDYVDPWVSAIAEEFTSGSTMTANKWYYYTVPVGTTYTITAGTELSNIIYTTNGDQLKSVADEITAHFSASQALSAGRVYIKSSSAQTLTFASAVAEHANTIISNKGDITSLINGTFDTNADGWSDYTGYCVNQTWTNRGWRGDVQSGWIERNSNGTMTCTVANMPAGSYKVVAAARSYVGGKIKAQVAGGSYGIEMTGTGDSAPAGGTMEINTNGVEMPYSSLGGFTTVDQGHNWHWISATGTLAAEGNLVLNFTTTGNSWMAIDDVHLYCTQLGETSYTTTVTEGSAVSNSDGKVVTCDIKLNNPNSIVTSDAAITTASGATMNNNLVGTNIAQLILYDGANNTFSMTSGDYTINNVSGAAKYYRQLTANQYCTVCLPFTPAIGTGTYYAPTSFENGTLTFAAVADKDLKPNTPYILKPSGSYTDLWNNNNGENSEKYNVKYANVRTSTSISSDAMWFTGTFEKIDNIGSWAGTYYVLGTDNKLHKVAGNVSVNPFRAYFYIPEANAARDFINISFDDDVTAINSAKSQEPRANGLYFDLQGRRVAQPTRGLYIVNGRKVVVK